MLVVLQSGGRESARAAPDAVRPSRTPAPRLLSLRDSCRLLSQQYQQAAHTMAAAKPRKVLFCGDVNGHVEALFKRVSALNASAAGPFDMVLCCGAFFEQNGLSVG